MIDNTRGKGRFARKQRPPPPQMEDTRWAAPRVGLTENNTLAFLRFVSARCDRGVFVLFEDLATMAPAKRLARNVSKLVSRLANGPVTDALNHGLTPLEHDALSQLERYNVPLDLLGVAHALLDVRLRQTLAVRIGVEMAEARDTDPPIHTYTEKD